MQARPLRKGSIIDVVAPAGPFDPEAFRQGIALIEAHGYRPRFREDIFARDRFLAGADDRRFGELRDALTAEDSDLVWAARGGYGVMRLMQRLGLHFIRNTGKALVGFSDLTVLHRYWLEAGVTSVHGSMVARLASEPESARSRLFGLLETGRAPALSGETWRGGVAEGVLTGGNLAMLAATCGTVAEPYRLSGRVLFLEDIGERPYRLDRMLVQCRCAGLFEDIAAVVVGDFTDCDEKDGSIAAEEVLREHLESLGVPVLARLPCGHGPVNLALPFGVRVRVDATAGRLEFPESIYGGQA